MDKKRDAVLEDQLLSKVDPENPETQKRLRDAFTSPVDIANQTTKLGRQGSQTHNGLGDDDDQP